MFTYFLAEKSQLILIRSLVYILGVQQQAGVDLNGGWYGIGFVSGNFCSARLARTNGMLYSHEVAYRDC